MRHVALLTHPFGLPADLFNAVSQRDSSTPTKATCSPQMKTRGDRQEIACKTASQVRACLNYWLTPAWD
jgi:hypothetical protein